MFQLGIEYWAKRLEALQLDLSTGILMDEA
jgi:hypothetical protein